MVGPCTNASIFCLADFRLGHGMPWRMGKKNTWTGLFCQRRQHQHKILKPVPFTVGKSHEWIIGDQTNLRTPTSQRRSRS
jgi:hypothetical protein